MLALVPRIREEHPHFSDGSGREHGAQDLGGIGLHHAHVCQLVGHNFLDGLGQAGGVNLNGQEVLVRIRHGGMDDCIAQAGSDLHDQRRCAAKFCCGVKNILRVH